MAKILIFDPDTSLAKGLADILLGDGHKVEVWPDGNDGIKRIQSAQPELVILDVRLPVTDGLTLCRMMKRNPSTMHISIIFITSRGMERDIIEGLESGADDYIVKPFALGEFLARVRAVLRRFGRPIAKEELQTGNLLINVTSRRVYVGSEELSLRRREFDVLVLLMRNRGHVLSRELIISKVWGPGESSHPRSIDGYIRVLRAVIDTDTDAPSRIKTILKLGYRFEG